MGRVKGKPKIMANNNMLKHKQHMDNNMVMPKPNNQPINRVTTSRAMLHMLILMAKPIIPTAKLEWVQVVNCLTQVRSKCHITELHHSLNHMVQPGKRIHRKR